ncbi:MAG: hypothetical protein FD141_218 [Fusobacteria bacterium]|nr:MAG: hypothetical protein FD141_218 [Fusobacteriota bacterium]KAF0229118.1 MAG: hypothetical protein FD182_1374 [Fusobacteriota bacterium]
MNLPSLGINYNYPNTLPKQHFHSASVGKMITSTLVFIAIEMDKLKLDTKIKEILEVGMLDKLFVFKDHDYQDEITIKDLLGHTSGVNDYLESKAFDGSLFIDDILKNPNTFWKPIDLVDYTRNMQGTIGKPGDRFFYSDTGYVLLGLILETVFELPFHKILEKYIFQPAAMEETTFCFYSESFNQENLAPLYINGVDVHSFKSLSCDFSGGGLSTTTEDLLKFLEHFYTGKFISQNSIDEMSKFNHRYRQGLFYGLGMMETRFEEFFFLLRGLPRLRGHLGVTGVHAWYDPISKNSFVINVGNTKDMVKSFRLLIAILQFVQRER